MPAEAPIPAKNTMKYVARVSPVLLLLLLAGAVLFYKERMLYIDAPHVLFRLINDGHFWIEEHRYGSFISQLLPLAGAKLHLPLQCLMILYSASFYLFYLVVSLLLVYKFKNYGLAILLGLYFTLFVSSTYYWSNNEVHQGITWLLLVLAINFSVAAKRRHVFFTASVFTASFFLALWTHPLVMLAAVYLWFFYMADKAAWPYTKKQTVFFTGILLLLSFVKFYQGMHHGYDSSKIETLTQFQYQKIRTILSSPQLRFFLTGCATKYWLFSLLFFAGIIGMLAEKKYWLFALTLLFVAGYLTLTCITFRDVTSSIYMESEYMPLTIICCAPFVYYVLPKIRATLAVALFALIYLLCLATIYRAAGPFTNRVGVMEQINGQMGRKQLTKAIITGIPQPVDKALITNWAAPVESIYISKLRGETPQRTFVFFNVDQLRTEGTLVKDTLLGSYEKRGAARINSYYFQMDTTVLYTVIAYDSLMK